jgi:integral membrane protein
MISAPEAVSFIALMVFSLLKNVGEYEFAKPVVFWIGMVHGVLFIGYVLLWADAWRSAKWQLKTGAWYFLMSVLPTGGFFADRALRTAERTVPARPEPATA